MQKNILQIKKIAGKITGWSMTMLVFLAYIITIVDALSYQTIFLEITLWMILISLLVSGIIWIIATYKNCEIEEKLSQNIKIKTIRKMIAYCQEKENEKIDNEDFMIKQLNDIEESLLKYTKRDIIKNAIKRNFVSIKNVVKTELRTGLNN